MVGQEGLVVKCLFCWGGVSGSVVREGASVLPSASRRHLRHCYGKLEIGCRAGRSSMSDADLLVGCDEKLFQDATQ